MAGVETAGVQMFQSFGLWVIIGVSFIVLVGIGGFFIVFMAKEKKKYDHLVIAFEKDGFGKPNIVWDIGGIFIKGGYKRFWLRKLRSDLSADNVPYVKDFQAKKVVFLKRSGSKNYNYLSFDELFKENSEITIGEEDINSAVIDYENAKRTFGTSLWEKLFPYIGLIVMGVLILGMLAILLKDIPSIIASLNNLLPDLKAIAQAMAQMKSGTTVIQP
jgi:hypothetical protein